jgi:outer membrane protein OmpA-like peptidoglycan-associated protein
LGTRAPEPPSQAEILATLAKAPELAPYRLQVEIEGQTAGLSGAVPSRELRDTAIRIVSTAFPNMHLEDRISVTPGKTVPDQPIPSETLRHEVTPTKVTPDKVASPEKNSHTPEPEVQRLTSLFNQLEGVAISTRYSGDTVRVSGVVAANADLERIRRGFSQIPGISSVRCELKELTELPIGERIYFPTGSARLDPAEATAKIVMVKRHLDENPALRLKVIGHSDPTGNEERNRQLAQARAEAVKAALEAAGVTPGLLVAQSALVPPPDVNALHPLRMSRCVRFEPNARQ